MIAIDAQTGVQKEKCMKNAKLKAAREAAGKTQAQVAREAGITDRGYQNYELGKRDPQAATAIKIALALNSTVECLFGKGDEPRT